MDSSNVLVCSFYTADDYYRAHAASLAKNLESLGLAYELREIEKQEGEDWADICRKKIAFLNGVCEANPDLRVFWIDVDCKLAGFPEFVRDFTADILGFQRGFGNPLTIGYERRTRFWEPCFFGINTTPTARKFMSDAAELERRMDIKATDDYFFEESWRANAAEMSFQIIPSLCADRGDAPQGSTVPQFFIFGASGNVDEFKGKVEQHAPIAGPGAASVGKRARRKALNAAKRVESVLPDAFSRPLRRMSDTVGVTGKLVGDDTGASAARAPIVASMLKAAQAGMAEETAEAIERLRDTGVLSGKEEAAITAAESFSYFASRKGGDSLRMTWWARPLPGNFGDWLGPLVVANYTDKSIVYQAPASRAHKRHLVTVGSIGRFIKPNSTVVGTGISSSDIEMSSSATFVSVRGPITAETLLESGGPKVTSFGDPGVLLSRIMPIELGATNGRIAFVRHFTHRKFPVIIPEDFDELSVLMSHPDAIRTFVETLAQYDGVVTSAMHVMIVCHSYGIPCALVTFEGFEDTVHGTGIKYKDYSLGAGLSRVFEPVPVAPNLSSADLRGMLYTEKISEAKLDEVEEAVRTGIDLQVSARSRA